MINVAALARFFGREIVLGKMEQDVVLVKITKQEANTFMEGHRRDKLTPAANFALDSSGVQLICELGDFRLKQVFGGWLVFSHKREKNFLFVTEFRSGRVVVLYKVPGARWARKDFETHVEWEMSEGVTSTLKERLTTGLELAKEHISDVLGSHSRRDTVTRWISTILMEQAQGGNVFNFDNTWYFAFQGAELNEVIQGQDIDFIKSNPRASYLGYWTTNTGVPFVVPLTKRGELFYAKKPKTKRMDILVRAEEEVAVNARVSGMIRWEGIKLSLYFRGRNENMLGVRDVTENLQYIARNEGEPYFTPGDRTKRSLDQLFTKIVDNEKKATSDFIYETLNTRMDRDFVVNQSTDSMERSPNVPRYLRALATHTNFLRIKEYFGLNIFGVVLGDKKVLMGAYTLKYLIEKKLIKEHEKVGTPNSSVVGLTLRIKDMSNFGDRDFLILEEYTDALLVKNLTNTSILTAISKNLLHLPQCELRSTDVVYRRTDGTGHWYIRGQSLRELNGLRESYEFRLDAAGTGRVETVRTDNGNGVEYELVPGAEVSERLLDENDTKETPFIRSNMASGRRGRFYEANAHVVENSMPSAGSSSSLNHILSIADLHINQAYTLFLDGEISPLVTKTKEPGERLVKGLLRMPHHDPLVAKFKISYNASKKILIPTDYTKLASLSSMATVGGVTCELPAILEGMYVEELGDRFGFGPVVNDYRLSIPEMELHREATSRNIPLNNNEL